jgi:hypothetical protein
LHEFEMTDSHVMHAMRVVVAPSRFETRKRPQWISPVMKSIRSGGQVGA